MDPKPGLLLVSTRPSGEEAKTSDFGDKLSGATVELLDICTLHQQQGQQHQQQQGQQQQQQQGQQQQQQQQVQQQQQHQQHAINSFLFACLGATTAKALLQEGPLTDTQNHPWTSQRGDSRPYWLPLGAHLRGLWAPEETVKL
ncbi:hypothetical protein EAH_00033380 [Eimeria acervulina]|uniref:Uncharacterized protein n=1 Tax=Eimeria acervulina TaxID=5801 RepID=U6GX67_EIMAC|nr:hypothetical protein EAH_00033380 [Eimeria acervulina]CDI83124.1 hypothetical protein EAH_00033380 [Eimeria acervulina]